MVSLRYLIHTITNLSSRLQTLPVWRIGGCPTCMLQSFAFRSPASDYAQLWMILFVACSVSCHAAPKTVLPLALTSEAKRTVHEPDWPISAMSDCCDRSTALEEVAGSLPTAHFEHYPENQHQLVLLHSNHGALNQRALHSQPGKQNEMYPCLSCP